MRASLIRVGRLAGFVVLLGTTGAVATRAEDPSDVLKASALTHVPSATWAIEEEATILRTFKDVQASQARLKSGEAQLRELQSGSGDPKVMAQYARQQAAMLGQEANMINQEISSMGRSRVAGSYRNMLNQQRNQVLAQQRQLNSLAGNLNSQGPQFEAQKKQFAAEVAKWRETYEKDAEGLHESVEKAIAKYNELAKDEPIAKALVDLSKKTSIKQKLGPSKNLIAVVKWLDIPITVHTETIELQREGSFDRIPVQFNAHSPVNMVLDTESPQTFLTAAIAAKIGLKMEGTTVDAKLPDGTTVKAKEVVVPTVRVGRFAVKDVTCVILPEGKGDSAPILGQSFLGKLESKYMKSAHLLVVVQNDPGESDAAGTAKAKAASRRARAAARSKAKRATAP